MGYCLLIIVLLSLPYLPTMARAWMVPSPSRGGDRPRPCICVTVPEGHRLEGCSCKGPKSRTL